MTEKRATVGVLYPGEMGASLAARLAARGPAVVTTAAGRGERTARRCRGLADAGVSVVDTAADVVRRSDVCFSLVPPAAAEDMAAAYCGMAHLAPAGAVYVDANSIRPESAAALAARVAAAGREFVDAAINGLAKNLAAGGTMFLSGRCAGRVAEVVGDATRVRVVGEAPGRASAMKMLLSGLSKGLCALYAETALAASRQGMLAEMNEAYTQIYPGVMAVVDRMLPTYARHAARRATETRELEQTVRAAGVEPCVLAAVRRLHELLAEVPFGAPNGAPNGAPSDVGERGGAWTAASLVERLAAEGFLAADPHDGGRGERPMNRP